MSRRLQSAAAMAALSMTLLAGCGSSDGSSSAGGSAGGAPITVWHGYTDVENTEIIALAGKWNAQHPTEKVNLVFDGGNDSALAKTTAALAAGKYPDIAYEYGSSATDLEKKKQLVDLTDVVKDKAWNWPDFFASERQA